VLATAIAAWHAETHPTPRLNSEALAYFGSMPRGA
jgi:hypothetical protein